MSDLVSTRQFVAHGSHRIPPRFIAADRLVEKS
jgi:hypothetical protein